MMDVQDFVSVPFNAVIIVVMGLVLSHNYRLFCLLSVCAFLIQLYLTLLPSDIGAGDGFLSLPIVKYAESESSKQLVLWLARSVASLVCSGVVFRVACRTLRSVLVFNKEITISFLVLLSLKTLGPELSDVMSMSTLYSSLSLYVIISQVADTIRCTAQVVYYLKRAKVGKRKEDLKDHWLATFSVLIIIQDVFSIIYSEHMSWHAGADILLQLAVVAHYLKKHPSFNKLMTKLRELKKVLWKKKHRKRRKRRKRKVSNGFVPLIPTKERCKAGSLLALGSQRAFHETQHQINQPENQHHPNTPPLRPDCDLTHVSNLDSDAILESEDQYNITENFSITSKEQHPLGIHPSSPTLSKDPKRGNYVLNPQSDVEPENLNPQNVMYSEYPESDEITRPQQAARENRPQQLVT